MSFTLPSLPYDFGALAPHIDSQTMQIHHGKHHGTYVSKLNAAIDGTEMSSMGIEDLLRNHSDIAAVRDNGGGHYNHTLFWQWLSPKGGGKPEGDLLQAIENAFGSFEGFKSQFTQAALTRFGSGWAWLCHKDGRLAVCSTANQDNPLMPQCGSTCVGCKPILGIDVWEHAYYLSYQNRRPDYIEAFFKVINWPFVAKSFASA